MTARPVAASYRAAAAVVLSIVALASRPANGQRPASSPPRDATAWDLPAVFQPGAIFQDRNGDGVIDFVAARIVIGDAADDDVPAAADVGARLGFETSAMDLPITGAPDAPDTVPIVIGAAGLSKSGIAPAMVGAAGLAPGEGMVAAVTVAGRKAVVIAGGDTAGTRAAAEAFAGRVPRVWDPRGATLEQMAVAVKSRLAAAGIAVATTAVPEIRVRTGAAAFSRAIVTVRLESTVDLGKVRAALSSANNAASFPGVESIRVDVVPPSGAPGHIDLPRVKPPDAGPMPARPAPAKPRLGLGTMFSSDGFFGDADNNLIPDRFDVLLCPSGPGTRGTIDLAARMGLESAGIAIPAAQPADAISAPESGPTLVLIGLAHPLTERLIADGKLARPSLAPGEGWIGVVPRAFGAKSAVVITGADERGLARALAQVAERFPHVWQRGKDRTTVADIEEDVRQFLSGRSPAGQAATALYKLDQILSEVAPHRPTEARVTVSLDKLEPALKPIVEDAARARLPGAAVDVSLDNRDVQHAGTIFTDDWDVPSEVDDFWRVFRARVLPGVTRTQPVVVEARLNEPPAIRRQIEKDATAALLKAGAAASGTRVTVISAYKQGFSWLEEVVGAAVAGKPVERVVIRFAEMGPPSGWPQGSLFAPTRWLLEAFPIDEVLARELKIDASRITFEEAPIGAPAYEAIVSGPGGVELFRQTFEPKVVVRPYFDVFPNYEKVRVTTGWVTATSAGRTLADERIATDTERVWDRYQAKTLPALYDYVMKIHEGKPRQADAPYFGELTIEASLSEPDYELGIDKEQMMSMESLHEDLYFTTIEFFRVLGRFTRGQPLDFPGRIVPIMHPKADGRGGHARVTLTGFAAPRPGIRVEYRGSDGRTRTASIDVPKVQLDAPAAWAARVRSGQDGLVDLDLRVKVDSDRDDRATLIRRQPEDRVDARMMSAEEIEAIVGNLARLRAAGLYRDALAYRGVGAVRVAAHWDFEPTPASERIASLPPNGVAAPAPDIAQRLPAGYRYRPGVPIVQWDTPIPPPEAYELLAKMSTFPEATVYRVGESYLGKEIWAMDLMPPIRASHASQAKLSTLKPTVIYSGRQHANEVSSTSHVLKLAELLLTDPAYRRKLDKVNVVIHPITNPDGAQLAYDLYKITPDYSLHAGYLAALGADVTSGQWDQDRIYPEAGVRPKLWRTWAPDIFLNPHGYPTHMWVQPFSEFIGPVRNGRVTEERHWGIIRGWFMPSFNYIDDPRYPYHKQAAFAIRDRIQAYIQDAKEQIAMNRRAWARYQKYGLAFDTTDFKDEDFSHGAVIYTDPKGSRGAAAGAAGQGDFMVRQPNVTIWSGTTEAPDETAYGAYLKQVAAIGLQWDKASLDYLVEAPHRIDRRGEAFFGGVALTVSRERPARSAKDAGSRQ